MASSFMNATRRRHPTSLVPKTRPGRGSCRGSLGTTSALPLKWTERNVVVPRTTPRILASHPAPADCSHLVELAGRMSVPTDYAIHHYIDLGNRHDVIAGAASPDRGTTLPRRGPGGAQRSGGLVVRYTGGSARTVPRPSMFPGGDTRAHHSNE
jgi:hypothetical protein